MLIQGLPLVTAIFFKMGQTRPLFVYFRPFSQNKYSTNLTIIESIDGVLRIRTWGGRMVGIDESTELWRRPSST